MAMPRRFGVCAGLLLPVLALFCLVLLLSHAPSGSHAKAEEKPTADAEPLKLHARTRVETAAGSGRFHTLTQPVTWDPRRTAIVVCDMWDKHWCANSTVRVGEMSPRMNEVLKAARQRGVFIIHCPSDTMDFYKDTPQRKRAQEAPAAEAKVPLQRWCRLDASREAALPIDDTDGGCDACEDCKTYRAWSRQIATLEIAPEDAITDSAEAYNLMQQRGIENVIVMGVHTNMCVLGRPFSIRQMVYQGKNVVLMRDMTDTMYNPAKAPFVSHFTGTDLVVEHIERHWCPTITSADLLGGKEFRFKEDHRSTLAIVASEDEYGAEQSLTTFASKYLGQDFRVRFVYAQADDKNQLPGLDALDEADLALFFIRRRALPEAQLASIRKFIAAGKPLVALRTSSHAFSLRPGTPLPAGHAEWPEFDAAVLGGHYTGHHSEKAEDRAYIQAVAAAREHPILTGVPTEEFAAESTLYMTSPVGPRTQVLLMGRAGELKPHEPVAWTNVREDGGKVFYTSLGHRGDFEIPAFRRLLVNGLCWAAGLPIPKEVAEKHVPQDYAAGWVPTRVPGTWDEQSQGALAGYDGLAWYRCVVNVPAAWKGQALVLAVEQLDNAHEAYFNGMRLGSAGALPPQYENGVATPRRYDIPADIVRGGEHNLLALRVYDHDGAGGFKGPAPVITNGPQAIKLAGLWQLRTGDDLAWVKSPERIPSNLAVFSELVAGDPALAPPVKPAEPGDRGPLTPAESLATLVIPADLEIQQVLAEPDVAQPVFFNFDEKGRMWVVQYLQYPEPAGLKIISRDNHWRAVYDKVPVAPPHHERGKDKITIHEDTDGDGIYDRHKTFVDGLNITSACAKGRGGVWVLNPPYLLFYPDQNNDDVPDGDPEVHLEGFGIEDTHSVVNSLRFAPDGWLYAAQGSTVTGNVKQPGSKQPGAYSLGQLIWRYHPETKRYEIFAEGGGNAFGVELDAKGRIYSGHNGGNTRGFHYVQGAYLQKGFTKHGPLSNPYSFGFFPAMQHHNVPRFTHNFVIYEGGSLPAEYHGKLFGVAALLNHVVMSEVLRDGSSFKTHDVGHPITTSDFWFRPVDIKVGPDGAIYVADWYDGYVSHLLNRVGKLDQAHGRIYRLGKRDGARGQGREDLGALKTGELIGRLDSPNTWTRQTILRVLGDRHDKSAIPELQRRVHAATGQLALDTLWALSISGGLDEATALRTLDHADPYVRLWTARILCDEKQVTPAIAQKLAERALAETDVEARSQLACSARRLPASASLPIVRGLLTHAEDAADIHIPLLLWWAIETHVARDSDAVLALFHEPAVWKLPVVEQHLLERLMRRYASPGTRRDLLICAQLLKLSPGKEQTARLLAGFEEAFKGRSLATLPPELVSALTAAGGGSVALQVRQGNAEAIGQALAVVANEQAAKPQRLEFIQVFGEVAQPTAVPVLLQLIEKNSDDELRMAALTALQQYDGSEISTKILALYPTLPEKVREVGQTLLASRRTWALQLLQAVDSKRIAAETLPLDVVRKLTFFRGDDIAALIARHWTSLEGATTGEMQQQIERFADTLQAGSGDPYAGKKLFAVSCAKCHVLYGQGGRIGPDLTTFKRDDAKHMLMTIVNPSAEIREGFETVLIVTDDGRTVSGFLADRDDQVVVLRGVDGQDITVTQDRIDEMLPQRKSLMPEGLLKDLNEQQVRDLFAYLRTTQPLP